MTDPPSHAVEAAPSTNRAELGPAAATRALSRPRCPDHGLYLSDVGVCSRCAERAEVGAAWSGFGRWVAAGLAVLVVVVGGRAAFALAEGVWTRVQAERVAAPSATSVEVASAASEDSPVVMYTMEGCAACGAAKAWMLARGIQYEERRPDVDEVARGEMQQLGSHVVPTTVVGERVLTGFDIGEYQSALGRYARR